MASGNKTQILITFKKEPKRRKILLLGSFMPKKFSLQTGPKLDFAEHLRYFCGIKCGTFFRRLYNDYDTQDPNIIIPIFNETLENKRFMRSVCCAGQSLCFAQDWYCTASSKARCAFACEPDGSQAIKRFLIVLLKNSIK